MREQFEDDDYERYWDIYGYPVIGGANAQADPDELLEDDELSTAEAGFWCGGQGTT